MDADTTVMLEGIALLVFAAFIITVLAIVAWQSWRKDRARRVNRPVRAEVVESTRRREENIFRLPEDWNYAIVVTTRLETGGRAFTITRQYRSEEEAAEFAAEYAVGTEHEVIPSLDRGEAFLPADFEPQRGIDLKDAPAWVIAIPVGFLLFVLAGVVKVVRDAP